MARRRPGPDLPRISPIKDFTETLQLELEFDPDDEDLRPPPKYTVRSARKRT